jgi:hypothetical protein
MAVKSTGNTPNLQTTPTDSIRTRVAVGYLFSTLPPDQIKSKIAEILKSPQDPSKKPKVKLNQPFDGSVLSGKQPFYFTVEAPLTTQPIVYLYVDEGVLLGRMNMAPYQYNLDTKKIPNGRHRMYGTVVTPEGTATSNVISVVIQN